ncbi:MULTISPECIES: D-alanyl-D-alanine carboxypeptidase family protein [unclassified Sedimentibacter]|uniref:D-alanyl-D-alanine carboxypeptidase family protein n=1 Tax=unclassified Sedimentibacter TaxID=2649220 RepID=UPI0027DFBCBE|nr:D-alanyl-D-alanine carboxypeptidase family protein [Sedimentibacter sp. MB35-C1]WMJ76221.1 D-alanyl-D-alanine carboxypeptidase family protein [Sedimentibacter sp. MB35-C1]
MSIKNIKILFFTALMLICSLNYNIAKAIPEVSAQAYIVVDSDSGRILCSRNPNEKLPIASTTKIITTILAIENIDDIDKKIEVPASCTGIEGSSIYLRPKQKVSIKDLLYGTMLRSGNDAASALALYAGRTSEDKFVEMMNEKAYELGAFNTNFENPHGLHNDNHYSTAYDLALISRHAMKNDTFKTISSAEKYKAESVNTIFYNKNKVVHDYEYGNGIKIGYTKAAGRCLVASAEKDGTEIIVVVLNDSNWFSDSYNLFDWAFENYKSYQIVEEGQFAGRMSSGNPVFISDSFSYLLSEDETENIRYELNITAPHILNKDNKAICGEYNIYLNNELIHTGSLVTENK